MHRLPLAPTIRSLLRHLRPSRDRVGRGAAGTTLQARADVHTLDLVRDGVRLARLRHADCVRIECLGGQAWVTRSGDPADHVLQPGESCTVARRDDAVITGMPRARVVLRWCGPGHAMTDRATRARASAAVAAQRTSA